MSPLTFSDLERLCGEAVASGEFDLEKLYEARDIDFDGILLVVETFLALALMDIVRGHSPSEEFKTMFHAGFDLGFKAAVELEMRRQAQS